MTNGEDFFHIFWYEPCEKIKLMIMSQMKMKLFDMRSKGRNQEDLNQRFCPDSVLEQIPSCRERSKTHVIYRIFHIRKGCQDHCSQENPTTATQRPFRAPGIARGFHGFSEFLGELRHQTCKLHLPVP